MAATEQFSLRWNNFHSNLTSGFHQLLEAADMVDVTLAVDGHFLQAHKIVLSICSPYFKQMFKLNPCKHPIVILRDVGHEHMKDILEFMYMGEVSVLRENLSAFLKTAELLQVKGLTGDDSSETSSRKDDKLDCDIEEEEMSQYDQMLEADVELPTTPQYPQKISPSPSTKRTNKSNSSGNAKRTKNESVTPSQSKKSVSNEQSDVKPKIEEDVGNVSEKLGEMDESTKEGLGQMWDNNLGTSVNDIKIENGGGGGGGGASWLTIERTLKPSGMTTSGGGGRPTYQCDKCWKRFSRRDHLRTHEKNIHGEDAGPFACAICSQLYKNTESLRKHIAKFHFPKEGGAERQTALKVEEIRVEN
ncbi:broad-complex core protein isoforms 1/2/3/4/5 isoform X1 [Aethina tumida]|uniref:broad-complex core protein isoforms 1/2/3/4/5 isoform X1 n=1 Tax=Aethina tumida TaxID=116153 RepID=UPI00214999C7|nr:broad-complex core protein isoforms 1/2/3/4/5 isoform X1 [Aethina tumida]